VEMIYNP